MADSVAWPATWSSRVSEGRGSSREAGEFGRPGRHSHNGAGAERRELPDETFADRPGEGRPDGLLAGGQQHLAQTRPRQHARPAPWPSVFGAEANASPTAENIPTIAAKTTEESLR
jgi:hypothetical protein